VQKEKERLGRALVRRLQNAIVQASPRIRGFRPFADSVLPEHTP
jgi:hypothetical protein